MTIEKGSSATLTWNTTNATAVKLDGVAVAVDGSKAVVPTATKTYTITATGAGGTVTCSKTITVTIPVPDPVCTLNAAPMTITKGQHATLTWTTTNATAVKVNGVTVALGGSQVVTPQQTTTYTLTATGNGKIVTCAKTVTVVPPTLDPRCEMDAAPTTITAGQSSKLSWSTWNVTSAAISPTIGSVALNAINDNQMVTPAQTTTYTLTASGNGKTITCAKTITVTPVVVGLSCDQFVASPSHFGVGGGTTKLTWNTTGASSVSISDIGNVGVDGNIDYNTSQSKTFTLTASNGQNQVQCQTSVSVDTNTGCTSNCGGGSNGGTSRPSCKFFKASDKDVEEGDKVTLSWETSRGQELLIKDNHGEEILDSNDDDEVDEGSIVVYPKKDTTYTLKVEGKSNKTDSCTVKVNVDDEVTVTTVRDRQPVTTITFRDVPYTGFDAGPMLAGLFYALLAAWALVASYIVVIKKGSVMGFSLATVGMAQGASYKAPVVARTATPVAPSNLPVARDDEDEEEADDEAADEVVGDEDAVLENRAFALGIILSKDALEVVKRADQDVASQLTIIDAIAARAKESFPREDGWIALDKARITTLFN
jgi:hypothetical protein